jgi:hypothetical protein
MKHNLTIEELYDIMEKHDWYYMYSDDGNVHRRGREASQKLQAMVQENKHFLALYNEYSDYISGNREKPTRPTGV